MEIWKPGRPVLGVLRFFWVEEELSNLRFAISPFTASPVFDLRLSACGNRKSLKIEGR